MDSLEHTMRKILHFRDARDWKQFHTPRNLAAALAIEAAELQEAMLWKTDTEIAESLRKSHSKMEIAAEISDVLIFALLFCDATGINPISAIHQKLKVNANKYPVKLAKGRATKYTRLNVTRQRPARRK